MTQINATLAVASEDVAVMKALTEKLTRLHRATLGKDILTLKEACYELKCSENTLKKWRDEGWLPFFSEGKIIKFEREAIVRAYKQRFGQQTHFNVVQDYKLNSKRRAS